jgi:hypothetical protein
VAARLNARHQAMVREKIKASQLINRLQDHVLRGSKMANSQVRAACYLVSQAIGNPPQDVSGSVEVEPVKRSVHDYTTAELLEIVARGERERRHRLR